MSALGCLEEAGGIMFLGCNGLPTTMGMSRLERLLSIVVRCSTLQVVEGFDGLDELWELEITAPNPQRISLPTLTRIETSGMAPAMMVRSTAHSRASANSTRSPASTTSSSTATDQSPTSRSSTR
jgi:hypothetical protein